MQSLSESRRGSKVTKPIFSNSRKRYYIKCSHSYKQPDETLILMERGISHLQGMATPVY